MKRFQIWAIAPAPCYISTGRIYGFTQVITMINNQYADILHHNYCYVPYSHIPCCTILAAPAEHSTHTL